MGYCRFKRNTNVGVKSNVNRSGQMRLFRRKSHSIECRPRFMDEENDRSDGRTATRSMFLSIRSTCCYLVTMKYALVIIIIICKFRSICCTVNLASTQIKHTNTYALFNINNNKQMTRCTHRV